MRPRLWQFLHGLCNVLGRGAPYGHNFISIHENSFGTTSTLHLIVGTRPALFVVESVRRKSSFWLESSGLGRNPIGEMHAYRA